MYARTTNWKGDAETLERWTDHVTRTVGPMVKDLPGNAGAFFFVDRDNGTALTLTLWESEQAGLETDRNADASRDSTIAATGIELLSRGRFQVVARI